MLKINTEIKLPKDVFGQEINLDLLAHARHVYTERSHVGLRSTKTRSEINRTTKKVYKQKGTGGARHGSRRANLFVGGGVIFGPRPLRRELTLSQSIRRAAKIAAFSAKSAAKKIAVISGISAVSKTQEIAKFLKTQPAKRFTILLADNSKEAFKFLRNLKNVTTVNYNQVSALHILNGGMILIDEGVFGDKQVVNSKKSVVAKTVKKTKTTNTKKAKVSPAKKGAK